MTNETTPARRIDDHLPSQPLHWEDQPEAVRQDRIKTAVRLESELAAAGAAYLAHMGTGGGIAAIPHTGPAQYVVAGTMVAISKVLGEQMELPVPRGGGITSIEGLTRYDHRGCLMAPDATGDYFLVPDVRAAIASQSQAAQPTVEQIMELAHAWAQAAYAKALNQPFADIDAICKKLRDAAAHIAGTSQATKAQADEDLAAKLNAAVDAEYPMPDTPHTSAKMQWVDNRAAMWRGINAARKILTPVAKEAPAVLEGATNCTLNGGDANGNQVFVSMDNKPSTHLWTVGGRAYLCEAAPQALATREAKDEQQANVLPPFAAPAGQQDADERAFNTLYGSVMNIPVSDKVKDELEGAPKGFYLLGHRDARHAAADLITELASGFREGRNTKPESAESSDVATTTSTVSAPTSDSIAIPCPECGGTGIADAGEACDECSGQCRIIVSRKDLAEGAQKAPEEVRNQALQSIANDGLDARQCMELARRALRTSSTDQANADTGSSE